MSGRFFLAAAVLCAAIICAVPLRAKEKTKTMPEYESEIIKLPEPKYDGSIPVEEALFKRRSVRDFKDMPLTVSEVSQLLWAAQGITGAGGRRTAPSAGALYPLEIYVIAANVNGLLAGIYKYRPNRHELLRIIKGDRRNDLCDAALGQSSIRRSAAVIVLSGVYERTTEKYGERGIRYVHMEVGHAAQNIYLQAVSLGLGTVVIGAFRDEAVKRIFKMAGGEMPLYIMPVGRR
jgi:SagB-type dehydrogenase family enzyme